MMVTVMAMTTARPMTPTMLITPADSDDNALASAMKVFERDRQARVRRARVARVVLFGTDRVSPPARAQGRSN
eukprot:3985424-Pyramimonas_sp.AAC.1